jgi:pentatricopeptide repeat protein
MSFFTSNASRAAALTIVVALLCTAPSFYIRAVELIFSRSDDASAAAAVKLAHGRNGDTNNSDLSSELVFAICQSVGVWGAALIMFKLAKATPIRQTKTFVDPCSAQKLPTTSTDEPTHAERAHAAVSTVAPDVEVVDAHKPSPRQARSGASWHKGFGEALAGIRGRGRTVSFDTPVTPAGRVAEAVSKSPAFTAHTEHADVVEDWQRGSAIDSDPQRRNELPRARATELLRTTQRLLNKVCPENVGTIVEQLADIQVNDCDELAFVIGLIFKRALRDPHYIETYADIFFGLNAVWPEFLATESAAALPVTFLAVLIEKCRAEFEALPPSFEASAAERETHEPEELEYVQKERKDKVVAFMRLMGNLYLRGLLSTVAIGAILQDLVRGGPGCDLAGELEIECTCQLLRSVGAALQSEQLGCHLISKTCGELAKLRKEGDAIYSKRLQFMIQDLVDLRDAHWMQKAFKSAAKTKDDIKQDAADEEQLKHHGENGVLTVVAGARPDSIAGTKVHWGEYASTSPVPPSERGDVCPQADTVRIPLPYGGPRKILGPSCATVNTLQAETGARVFVDTKAMEVVIKGSEEAVATAKQKVLMLLESQPVACRFFSQGHCSRGKDCAFAHVEKNASEDGAEVTNDWQKETKHSIDEDNEMNKDARARALELLNGSALTYAGFKDAINACDKCGQWSKALELLELMPVAKVDPDVIVYSLVINACARGGQCERALDLLIEMRAKNVMPNILSYNAALHGCNKCNQWEKTIELLNEMKKEGVQPNGSSYREAVDACGKLGRWQKAVELVHVMRSEGVEPHIITYNTAIHGCVKSKLVEKAMEFFQDLLQTFNTPEIANRRRQVATLVNKGDFRSAISIYYEMHHAGLLRLSPENMAAPKRADRIQWPATHDDSKARINSGKQLQDTSRFRTVTCKFFAEGKCMKGRNCPYMHAPVEAGPASDGDDDETRASGSASEAGDSSSPYSVSEAPASPIKTKAANMVR